MADLNKILTDMKISVMERCRKRIEDAAKESKGKITIEKQSVTSILKRKHGL